MVKLDDLFLMDQLSKKMVGQTQCPLFMRMLCQMGGLQSSFMAMQLVAQDIKFRKQYEQKYLAQVGRFLMVC